MRLFTALKKNIVPILFVGLVVGLLIYMTQRKEGFQFYTSVSSAIRLSEPYPKVNQQCVLDTYNSTSDEIGFNYCRRTGYIRHGSKCVKQGRYRCPTGKITYNDKCQEKCISPYLNNNLFGSCKHRKENWVRYVNQVRPVCSA